MVFSQNPLKSKINFETAKGFDKN